MAVAAYTTDLATVNDATSNSAWAEPTATGWTAGSGGPDLDTDLFIRGTTSISQETKSAGVAGLMADYGTGLTIAAGSAVFVWQYHSGPPILDTYANGGQRVMIGSSLADFYSWDTGGSNYPPNPYGG